MFFACLLHTSNADRHPSGWSAWRVFLLDKSLVLVLRLGTSTNRFSWYTKKRVKSGFLMEKKPVLAYFGGLFACFSVGSSFFNNSMYSYCTYKLFFRISKQFFRINSGQRSVFQPDLGSIQGPSDAYLQYQPWGRSRIGAPPEPVQHPELEPCSRGRICCEFGIFSGNLRFLNFALVRVT